MKRIAFLLLAAIMASHGMSAPARGGWKNIVLDDGSIVKVKLVGDEFCHYYITEDGRAIGDTTQRKSVNRSDIMKANTRSTSSDPIATPGKKKQLVLLMEFADKTFMGGDAYNHWNAASTKATVSLMLTSRYMDRLPPNTDMSIMARMAITVSTRYQATSLSRD